MKLNPIDTSVTLKDHIYNRMREAILEMDIYSDSVDLRLDERSLADQLGVSRTPCARFWYGWNRKAFWRSAPVAASSCSARRCRISWR